MEYKPGITFVDKVKLSLGLGRQVFKMMRVVTKFRKDPDRLELELMTVEQSIIDLKAKYQIDPT